QESGGSSGHPSQMRKIVLLFSAVDDTQPLAMHALAAALVAQGVTARIVTGPANAHRAMELVTMVRPVATVLVTSLTRPELGIVHALHEAQAQQQIQGARSALLAAERKQKAGQELSRLQA